MTECCALLSSVLAGESSRWTCREVSSDTVLLVTSHHYADGDTVELIAQTVGDEVIVSDGGEVLARLDSVGVNLDSQSGGQVVGTADGGPRTGRRPRPARASGERRAYRCAGVGNGRCGGQPRWPEAAGPVPRRPAFPERPTTYLVAEFPFVEPRAKLIGASGSSGRRP